ncbi:MAG: hypothetical protein LBU34_03295 [Planctomycetaceae bacterium]|nr:hypothetical protein [Planctomycetaceae bacterium]
MTAIIFDNPITDCSNYFYYYLLTEINRMDDKHTIQIPADIVLQIKNLVQQANELLLPYVTPLTPAERHSIVKMGGKTLSFVEKAHKAAAENSNLVPPFLNMAAFNNGFADARNLLGIAACNESASRKRGRHYNG